MKRAKKSIGLILAILLVLTTVSAGCTKKATTTKADTSKFVALSEYLIGAPAKDYDQMLTAFNVKAKKDLNCSLSVTWIGWGDYSTKYPLVLASGEAIDLIYTSSWTGFTVQATKGAFMPLEKLAPEYAPKSFAAQTPGMIKALTLNGHLDALSPKFSQYAQMGYIVRGDLMKKYGFANGSLKTMDDIGAFAAAVHKGEKGIDPFGFDSQSSLDIYENYQLGYFPFANIYNFPLQVTVDSAGMPTGTVKNIYEDPGYPAFFAKMKQWADAGYWPTNVLSNKDTSMLNEGTAAMRLHNIDSWVTAGITNPTWDMQFVPGYPHAKLTSAYQDAMAIPASSKNPERALMLIEKIRTDETYYDLLAYGIKDTDWKLNAKDEVVATDPKVWAPDGYCNWGFKDPQFAKDAAGSPATMKAVKDAAKATGIDTPYTYFSFNTESVKAQIAAIASAMAQYHDPLALGYVKDPVAGLATLKQKLKDAGVDAVQVELQKQVDAFAKTIIK